MNRDTHNKLIEEFKIYAKYFNDLEYKNSCWGGKRARVALGNIRKLALQQRMDIQVTVKEIKTQRGAPKRGRPRKEANKKIKL